MEDWREPHWKTGDWRLLSKDVHEWMDQYGKGAKFTCRKCGSAGNVDLQPHYRVAIFGCGHVMELPSRML